MNENTAKEIAMKKNLIYKIIISIRGQEEPR